MSSGARENSSNMGFSWSPLVSFSAVSVATALAGALACWGWPSVCGTLLLFGVVGILSLRRESEVSLPRRLATTLSALGVDADLDEKGGSLARGPDFFSEAAAAVATASEQGGGKRKREREREREIESKGSRIEKNRGEKGRGERRTEGGERET